MTGRKKGLILGIIIGIVCFYLSDFGTVSFDKENNQELANRPLNIALVDSYPAVLGAEDSIATPSPEIKDIDM